MNEDDWYLSQIPKPAPSRIHARSVSQVLDRLFLEKGYANEQSREELLTAWEKAVGPVLCSQSKVGLLKRGMLQIFAANEIIMSELDFQKAKALKSLQQSLPEMKIRGLKFHLQRRS